MPEHQRGTYLGLAHPDVVAYLVRLGVTSVQLMPVHAFVDEPAMLRSGRRNYWGYSTLGYLAPHAGYASVPGAEVDEFHAMVAALHDAGIEVLLDVVYNHTCEGAVDGTTLCWRGLDAPGYYLLNGDGSDVDLTGCGNTLDAPSPAVVRLVVDSMRYFAAELGVDGFRMDLAGALGRPTGGPFDPRASLLTAIASDPVLSGCKLIAEPWDATLGGYAVGRFGAQWLEFNDKFRDTVRDFWRGAAGIRHLASRFAGSADLYAQARRRPWASVNFVTAHDGFTLRDLVSYDRKHNEANGEGGADGSNHDRSWNCGAEGETDDPAVNALRDRQARNLLATLLLSMGTPVLCAGDERWRTQGGNNNPYCLDDETTWLASAPSERAEALLDFTRTLISLRATSSLLGRTSFLAPDDEDVVWHLPDGSLMTTADWHDESLRTLGVRMFGSDENGCLLLWHAGEQPVEFTLPGQSPGDAFEPVLDTGTPTDTDPLPGGATITLPPRTTLAFRE